MEFFFKASVDERLKCQVIITLHIPDWVVLYTSTKAHSKATNCVHFKLQGNISRTLYFIPQEHMALGPNQICPFIT